MTSVAGNGARGGLTLVQELEDASGFRVEKKVNSSEFYFSAEVNGTRYYWIRNTKTPGYGAFAGSNNKNDGNTASFTVWSYVDTDSDPYGLNNKTYGLMNWNGNVTGRAMMAESTTANAMDAKSLIVMSKSDNSSHLFVPNDSEISLWTFEWAEEDDLYYLKATVDGATQYLQITSDGLSLTGAKDENCKIQVIPGTGANAGQICLKRSNNTLTYTGSVENGFSVGGAAGSEWLYLVSLSELTSDYFMTYTANKISVSDTYVTY